MLNFKLFVFMFSIKMERYQNCFNFFNKFKYCCFVYQQMVKFDGFVMSIYFVNKDFYFYYSLFLLNFCVVFFYCKICVFENGCVGICSINKDIIYSIEFFEVFVNIVVGFGFLKFFVKLDFNIVFQGEFVGYNICGNFYGYVIFNDKVNGKIGDCGNGFDFFFYFIVDFYIGKKWNFKVVCDFVV